MEREALLQLLLTAASKGQLPKWLYHGTDSRALEGIKKGGLLAQKPGDYEDTKGVWMSPRQSTAETYARIAADARNPGVESKRIEGGTQFDRKGAPVVVRTRLKPALHKMDDRSLKSLVTRLGRVAESKGTSYEMNPGSYLVNELNTHGGRGVGREALKAAKLTEGGLGKFKKLGLVALLLSVLGPKVTEMMSPSGEETA